MISSPHADKTRTIATSAGGVRDLGVHNFPRCGGKDPLPYLVLIANGRWIEGPVPGTVRSPPTIEGARPQNTLARETTVDPQKPELHTASSRPRSLYLSRLTSRARLPKGSG